MPRIISIDYNPFPKQIMYHTSLADELLYGGAAGGGKTAATVGEAFKLALAHPGLQIYAFRRTFPELDKSLILEARKRWTGVGRYNKSDHRWEFPNGSCIWFCHCNHDADRYLYQGAEMHVLLIDELTHFTKEIYDYLKTRVRSEKKLNFRERTRATSNPGGIGHAWVKQVFADLEPYNLHEIETKSEMLQQTEIITRQYIPARVTDNPYISQRYIFELERKPPQLREALLEGKWDTFEGQVFFEWVNDREHYADHKKTHVISPCSLSTGWTRYRSFDWGYSKPFCVLWWAVDQDGRAYLYREWYGSTGEPNVGAKLSTKAIAEGIKLREAEDGYVVGYADPAIWNASTGESIAEQLGKDGVFFIPGDNQRLAGKAQMHNRLAFDENGIPMLYVFSTCKEFIRTVPSLVYSQIRVEDVDTDGEDHAYDAARYFLMARPIGMQVPTEKDPDRPDYESQLNDFMRYGR